MRYSQTRATNITLRAKITQAKENGRPVVYTFVPGNLTELLHAFDVLPVYPEINALQSGKSYGSGHGPVLTSKDIADLHSFRGARNLADHKVLMEAR